MIVGKTSLELLERARLEIVRSMPRGGSLLLEQLSEDQFYKIERLLQYIIAADCVSALHGDPSPRNEHYHRIKESLSRKLTRVLA
jgi:hypothetical protein